LTLLKSIALVSLFLAAAGCACAQSQSIVVTGAAVPIPLAEADRDVTVLPLAPNERPLFDSWFELLQLDPALDLRQRAPGGFIADLSIRGATFGQTLVLLNGLRLNDSQTGHFNLDLPVPLDMVSGMEVMKGSGSTLYGSDAIGGGVNVLTQVTKERLDHLATLAADGKLNATHIHRFPLAKAGDAFQLIVQDTHFGHVARRGVNPAAWSGH